MSSEVGKNIEQTATCSVCLELFDDPRVLPCQHTFCFKCIQMIHGVEQAGQVSCPLCRNKFKLQMPKLKRNFVAKSLVDSLILKTQKKFCKTHNAKELDLYCMSCHVCICIRCKLSANGAHKECQTAMLDEWVEKQKMENEAMMSETKRFAQIIQDKRYQWLKFSPLSQLQLNDDLEDCISILNELKSYLFLCSLKMYAKTQKHNDFRNQMCNAALNNIEEVETNLGNTQSLLEVQMTALTNRDFTDPVNWKKDHASDINKALKYEKIRDLAIANEKENQNVLPIFGRLKSILSLNLQQISKLSLKEECCQNCLKSGSELIKVMCTCGYYLCKECYQEICCATDLCFLCKHSITKSHEFQIFVKYENKSYTIFLSNEDTVSTLREKVEQKMEMPDQIFRLRTMHGKVLSDSEMLCNYDVRKDSTLIAYIPVLFSLASKPECGTL